MPVGMSAFRCRADVACQGLSGPFIANNGHSLVPKSGPLKGWNRPEAVIQVRCRERPVSDRKADIAYEEIIVRRSSQYAGGITKAMGSVT